MLEDIVNQEVKVTYVLGYSYESKKGIVNNISSNFITINNTMINIKMIVKIEIKENKNN